MIGRMANLAAVLALAACASSNELPPAAPAPPPPELSAPAPDAAPGAAAPEIAAPGVAAPPAPRPPAPRGDIVVPGQVERALPPTGDPRSVTERAQDVRAWDDCVMRAQGMAESDAMSPSLDTPEDICRQQLGMANRGAVPDSRRRDR